ncbi:hypothetical protein [Mycobacterium sp. 1274756.6]|uniref:hypothetical protein n=1 Tax=Mycobacterium sp. 1274756.6 TaxID=1834076 RepID=UPI0009EE3930|nr:hypothetical protein [Mycobacterium sp. 1274756.6]
MGTSLSELVEAPHRTLVRLTGTQAGVSVNRAWAPLLGGYVVDLTLAPPPELVIAGYANEGARVSISPAGEIFSFPLGPRREWKHRYSFNPDGGCIRQLCLWFPEDPRPLRWVPDDGFEDYVARVHRHLFYEEFWRRTGFWPTEDAPHGNPGRQNDTPGEQSAYPIRSAHLRQAVENYRRNEVKDRRQA